MAAKDDKKFDKELQKWLNEEIGWGRWAKDLLILGIRKVLPSRFRWLAMPYQLSIVALAASGPFISYQTSGAISVPQAILYASCLWVALLLFQTLDTWSQERKGTVSTPLQTIWVRIGDLLHTVKSSATAAKVKDSSIEATLAIATSLAAQIAKLPPESIGASLVQYHGTGYGKMKVTHRNRGSLRPCPRQVRDVSTLLGHHACQNDAAPRVVPDIRRFGSLGMKSPTQTTPEYRSIFIQPLVSNENGEIKGFISIDCTVHLAFNGRRADDLVALLEPIKAHIEEMI